MAMNGNPEVRATTVQLRASDGHALAAYRVEPPGHPRAGLVVLQEIFGVNAHVREVSDGYARRGYLVHSPALFDRAERGVALDYSPASVARGRALRAAIGWEASLRDVQAAIDEAAAAGPVAVLGFCWGGSLAFLSTTRLSGLACAVGYYGGQIAPFAAERIRVPLLLHFGELDPRVPPEDIARIREHNPDIEVHTFPADHGFNCDHRQEWHEASARQALDITLAFLDRHLRPR